MSAESFLPSKRPLAAILTLDSRDARRSARSRDRSSDGGGTQQRFTVQPLRPELDIAVNRYQEFVYEHYRAINAFKAGVAVLIAMLLNFTPLPEAPWVAVTVIIVMSTAPYVGSLLDKVWRRTIGTVAAGVFATCVVLLGGAPHTPLTVAAVVLATVLGFYYIPDKRVGYAATVFALTTVILLSFPGSTEEAVIWRSINIIIGGLIALLVSALVFPHRLKTTLRVLNRRTTTDFHQLIDLVDRGASRTECVEMEESVAAGFVEQRGLIPDLWRESPIHHADTTELLGLIQKQLSLLRRVHAIPPKDARAELTELNNRYSRELRVETD